MHRIYTTTGSHATGCVGMMYHHSLRSGDEAVLVAWCAGSVALSHVRVRGSNAGHEVRAAAQDS